MANSGIETQVVRAYRHGPPDVLEVERATVPPPGRGEVRLVQSAVGLNFADIYQRRGEEGPHMETNFPYVPGAQGAGVVESVGEGVDGVAEGDRVALIHPGGYAGVRNVPADRLVKLPEDISEQVAGATLLRGLTAEYLLNRLYQVKPGVRVLIHAAAGGMGAILVPWARALGAEIIATAGGPEKCGIARKAGAHHVIDYRKDDFVEAVKEITGGEGVHVVYDSVGKDTFMGSLDCLRPMGMAINYGTASGQAPPFPLQRLHSRSLIVTRPTLKTWIAAREDLDAAAERLFAAARRGDVPLEIGASYALSDVRTAHADLEARRTTGALVLLPDG